MIVKIFSVLGLLVGAQFIWEYISGVNELSTYKEIHEQNFISITFTQERDVVLYRANEREVSLCKFPWMKLEELGGVSSEGANEIIGSVISDAPLLNHNEKCAVVNSLVINGNQLVDTSVWEMEITDRKNLFFLKGGIGLAFILLTILINLRTKSDD